MISDSKRLVQPLLESADGIHLTGYIVNRGSLSDIKRQLREIVSKAYKHLLPVMSPDRIHAFLTPLNALKHERQIFGTMSGNIGLFRTEKSFQILNIPVALEEASIVANSFHVKPLLRWLQTEEDFLLLGLDRQAAHLYFCSRGSFAKLHSIYYPNVAKSVEVNSDYEQLQAKRRYGQQLKETFATVNAWLAEITASSQPRLFIAGEEILSKSFYQNRRYSNTDSNSVATRFSEELLNTIQQSCYERLKKDVAAKLDAAITEFKLADVVNRSKKNIFQIAKAALEGKVRKLIIADEVKIFGRLNKTTGALSINPFDLDHEDDDILDDIAQSVLAQGGEVFITSQDRIPKGHPVVAITDYHDLDKSTEYEDLSQLQGQKSNGRSPHN